MGTVTRALRLGRVGPGPLAPALIAATVLVAGCDAVPGLGRAPQDAAQSPPEAPSLDGGDVPAPEEFQSAGLGVWDGRPSLGGVWVADPRADRPRRVLISAEDTGVAVAGALFRRDDPGAGPPIQVSSEAAAALGLVAETPARLTLTALRRPEPPLGPADLDGGPAVEPDLATDLATGLDLADP